MSDDPAVAALLSEYPPAAQQLTLRVRKLLLRIIPDVHEHVYPGWRIISFRMGDAHKRQICWLAPQRFGVNLGFEHGAELPDPSGLLTGDAKQARNVHIRSARDVDVPKIAALVAAAVELRRDR
ncbi:hypothetical protein SOCE836_075500 [Sorangium cellulosum]|uniref:YdhG-like domain-containing protein n=1 Tax=Sorangium cellulosum TaxID=56 RepID=A0A4P2QXU4_SORCE|nr:hypothetical protein SOCE836_075500 [Sorangium cellulosum]WCQ94662.1 hypothetical protein NQZ70_07430 [Sorangium sp. Soce836]